MAVQATIRTHNDHPREGACAGIILAATAHELRLPLSHIKGFVSSLRRTDVLWDPTTEREFLEEIEIEADRLGELIDALLEDGHLNATIPESDTSEPTSPAQVIQSAVHHVRGFIGERQVRVDVAESLPVLPIDRNSMERVLANLLQNAAKFSPPDSPIGVSARRTRDSAIEFAVEDQGPGVPPEDREHIFQPFFRRQSQVSGHGLGLAIAWSIVRAHGGDIYVTDRPGGGARFVVVLPERSQAH